MQVDFFKIPTVIHLFICISVRGPIVTKSMEISKALKDGKSYPFNEVISCNIVRTKLEYIFIFTFLIAYLGKSSFTKSKTTILYS
jgi:hypothetical protein